MFFWFRRKMVKNFRRNCDKIHFLFCFVGKSSVISDEVLTKWRMFAPPSRCTHRPVFDSMRQRVILFLFTFGQNLVRNFRRNRDKTHLSPTRVRILPRSKNPFFLFSFVGKSSEITDAFPTKCLSFSFCRKFDRSLIV